MEASYTPVQWVYREVIEEELAKRTYGKVFFFDEQGAVSSVEGGIVTFEEIAGQGLFIRLDSPALIRVDRIITLFGKPGAAYDVYDSFGNACMDCTGGYESD